MARLLSPAGRRLILPSGGAMYDVEPVDPGAPRTWYVRANGGGATAEGDDPADPFSWSWARSGAGGFIKPGHTIELMSDGGAIPIPAGGAAWTRKGTEEAPILIRPWASNTDPVEFDASLPGYGTIGNALWQFMPEMSGIGVNIWRTTEQLPAATYYEGFVEVDGTWLPLIPYKHLTHFTSNYHNYRKLDPFYLGAGFWWDSAERYLYVRIDNCSDESMCCTDAESFDWRPVKQFGSTDPRQFAIRLFRTSDILLHLNASHIDLDVPGMLLRFGSTALQFGIGTANMRAAGFEAWGGLLGFRATDCDGFVVEDFMFDGRMEADYWWSSWTDHKGGLAAADRARKSAMNTGLAVNGVIRRGEINHYFDGNLGGGADVHFEDIVSRVWDDFDQQGATAQGRIHLRCNHHGAGPSLDAYASATAQGDREPLWFRCIMDPERYPIFWGRPGSEVSAPDGQGVGRYHPIAISAHGGRTGATEYALPKWVIHCTINYGFRSRSIGFNLGPMSPTAGNIEGVNRVYNNIIIWQPGIRFSPLARDGNAVNGWEDYDGNVWSTNWTRAGSVNVVFQLLKQPTSLVDPTIVSRQPKSFTAMKDAANANHPAYVASGWEEHGIDVDLPKSELIDADYRPIHPETTDGAIDLTHLGIPGYVYVPYRGAVEP